MAVLGCGGCGDLGYYAQSVRGQAALLLSARPIAEVAARADTAPALRRKLELARRIRAFAASDLGLPDNGSYTAYVAIDRPYVVWNVFAAPAYAIRPLRWCYPVAGCLAYRGYFDLADARSFAATLAAAGRDVYIGGVPAYSTLGWFDDPLPSSVIDYDEAQLAGLIFHELAHQVAYVPGQTTFNESFATLVELEGIDRWFAAAGHPGAGRAQREQRRREQQVIALLLRARERLAREAYALEGERAKDVAKRRILAELDADYARLVAGWPAPRPFQGWFPGRVNNANLAVVGAYYADVPALRAILESLGGDLPAFYGRIRELARLPDAQRRRELEAVKRATGQVKR